MLCNLCVKWRSHWTSWVLHKFLYPIFIFVFCPVSKNECLSFFDLISVHQKCLSIFWCDFSFSIFRYLVIELRKSVNFRKINCFCSKCGYFHEEKTIFLREVFQIGFQEILNPNYKKTWILNWSWNAVVRAKFRNFLRKIVNYDYEFDFKKFNNTFDGTEIDWTVAMSIYNFLFHLIYSQNKLSSSFSFFVNC